MIENKTVLEINLMPDGAAGSSATKALWIRVPMRTETFGMLMVAFAWPLLSSTPR